MFRFKIPRHNVNLSKNDISLMFKTIINGDVLGGEKIEIFEKKFSNYINSKNTIAVHSGRSAFYLILKSLKIKKGDEIILPSFTVHIVPNIIRIIGAKPVFVDVDQKTFNIDTNLIKHKITKKTRAIIPTHLFGQPCDINPILEIAEKKGLFVIEDCCQSLGAEYRKRKVGSFGDISFFSFNIGKNLATFGGGAISTNNEDLYEIIKNEIKNYKFPKNRKILKRSFLDTFVFMLSKPKIFTFTVYPILYISDLLGFEKINEVFDDKETILKRIPGSYKRRFTNLQATIAIEQLKRLDDTNKKRIKNANMLTSLINNISYIETPHKLRFVKHIYLYYPIKVKNKDLITKRLLRKGVDVKKKFIFSCSNLKIFKDLKTKTPVSDSLENELIWLPMNNSLKKKDILFVYNALKDSIIR